VPANNRTLIFVDIIYAILSLIFGTVAITSIVRYVISSLKIGTAAPWTWSFACIIVILMVLTIFTYRKIEMTPIRMLVIILLFVPQIVSLIMAQTIPFPEVSFLNT